MESPAARNATGNSIRPFVDEAGAAGLPTTLCGLHAGPNTNWSRTEKLGCHTIYDRCEAALSKNLRVM
jgi:hypothetical protein